MPDLTSDAVIDLIRSKMVSNDISMYATGSVNAYSSPGGTFIKRFPAGSFIGNIFSYVNGTDGLYWMFDNGVYDPNNPSYLYIKNDPASLSVPMIPDLIQQVQDAKDQQQKDQKGIIPYYIEKYAPWIVGGIVVAVALPSIVKSTKNVSGMNENNANAAELIGTAVLIYFLSKKKTTAGMPEFSIDQGSFGTDAVQSNSISQSQQTGSLPAQSNAIQFVGPFAVQYQQKGNLGLIKMN